MDEMLVHCKAVARGARRAFLVGDMPFGSGAMTGGTSCLQQSIPTKAATRHARAASMPAHHVSPEAELPYQSSNPPRVCTLACLLNLQWRSAPSMRCRMPFA